MRRIRAARWSRRNRLSSRSGSSSLRSSRSMSASCWSTSERLRRDNVSNMSPTCSCRLACSPASSTACSCSSSTACATCPTSSVVYTGSGCTGSAGAAGTRPLQLRARGPREPPCRAPSRSRRSGRTSVRATSVTISRAIRMATPTITESRMASVRLAAAWSSTPVGDGLGGRIDDLAARSGWWPATTELSSGLFTNGTVGSDIKRHPLDHLGLQLLGVGRADAEHLAHPEQRRRLGARQGDHRGAQLGLGNLAAEVHQQLLHQHLAAGTDRAGQAQRLGADLLVVDAHRPVDRVLGGQQDRRVGGDLVAQPDAVGGDLVQQRLPALRATR